MQAFENSIEVTG